jgi:hypothetical protein
MSISPTVAHKRSKLLVGTSWPLLPLAVRKMSPSPRQQPTDNRLTMQCAHCIVKERITTRVTRVDRFIGRG